MFKLDSWFSTNLVGLDLFLKTKSDENTKNLVLSIP